MSLFIYPPTPAPVGGATEATQLDVLAEVTDINSLGAKEAKQDDQITEAQSTNTKLDTLNATDFATQTTLAAAAADMADLNARLAGSLVPEEFDYQSITYVGATTDISTVTYKLGGSGGTTVAVLTLGYDGSNRLTSVTRS